MINLPPPPDWKPSNPSSYKGVSRHATQEERKLIAEHIRQHGGYKAADHFNVSYTLIKSVRKQFNIAPMKIGRQRQYGDKDILNWIEFLKANGNVIKHCATNFSISHDTLRRLIKEYEHRTNTKVLRVCHKGRPRKGLEAGNSPARICMAEGR